jgi:predicted nucleotide-binding protein
MNGAYARTKKYLPTRDFLKAPKLFLLIFDQGRPFFVEQASPSKQIMKPKLFIGSSVEGLPIARAAQQNLRRDSEVTI